MCIHRFTGIVLISLVFIAQASAQKKEANQGVDTLKHEESFSKNDTSYWKDGVYKKRAEFRSERHLKIRINSNHPQYDSIIRHYDQIFLGKPGKETSKHPGKEQKPHSTSKGFHYRVEIKNSEVKNKEMWRE